MNKKFITLLFPALFTFLSYNVQAIEKDTNRVSKHFRGLKTNKTDSAGNSQPVDQELVIEEGKLTEDGDSASKENPNEPTENVTKPKTEPTSVEQSESAFSSYSIVILALLNFTLALIVLYILTSKRKLREQLWVLQKQFMEVVVEINNLNSHINTLRNVSKLESKSEQEISKIKAKYEITAKTQNTLNKNEIDYLIGNNEGRWILIGDSVIGKSHEASNPKMPCQDSCFFKHLENSWNIIISSDGAGSAAKSDMGSTFVSKKALPEILENRLKAENWFKEQSLPTREQWRDLVISSINELLTALRNEFRIANEQELQEYACTLNFAIHNNKSVLIGNIGDGRGGYLNANGEFKPMFKPFKGQESNSTVFITTSALISESDQYIFSDVIDESLLSVFLLTDGMESHSFDCSQMVEDVFIDSNVPFKKFFYPILKTIKDIPKIEEEKLEAMLAEMLRNGTNKIKEEPDDKTLILTFYK